MSDLGQAALVPARVVEELKGFHRVRSENGEYLAEIAGRIRYQAEDRGDLPAVRDWVALAPRPEEGRARIEYILPRRTEAFPQGRRPSAGRTDRGHEPGCGVCRELAQPRVETCGASSGISQWLGIAERGQSCCSTRRTCAWMPMRAPPDVENVALGVPVHLLSAREGRGLETLGKYFAQGETAAFIGSSGVGKSSIINALAREQALRVQPVRESDDRGRHTTTSRQMIMLPGGGVVIDTPGMRELQLWDGDEGMGHAFEYIEILARRCRFRDCTSSRRAWNVRLRWQDRANWACSTRNELR